MDAVTLAALRGSIQKWEAIVAGTGDDFAQDNCPLCQMFYVGHEACPCRGCPVYARTGRAGCAGSPYDAYALITSLDLDDDEFTEASTAAARVELEFLRSLLPEEE